VAASRPQRLAARLTDDVIPHGGYSDPDQANDHAALTIKFVD
jgi:hypothetical protein